MDFHGFKTRLSYQVQRVPNNVKPFNRRGSRQWVVENSYTTPYPAAGRCGGVVAVKLEVFDAFGEPVFGLRAVAVCSYEDVFDLQTGKVLALERLLEQARIFAPDDIYVYIGDVLTANRVKLERQQARQRARQQVRQ